MENENEAAGNPHEHEHEIRNSQLRIDNLYKTPVDNIAAERTFQSICVNAFPQH